MKRTDAIGTAADQGSGRPARRRGRRRPTRLFGLGSLLALLLAPAAPAALRETDEFFSYQLSYIRSDRAITVLEELGYEVKRLTGAKPTDLLGKFDAYDFDQKLKRPVIIVLPDSAKNNFDPTKIADDKVTTGGPQQRLLIVWDRERPWELESLLRLLHEHLDVPAKQIIIEALVIELDRDTFRDLGVAFEADKDGNQASFLEDSATGVGLPFIYRFTRPSAKTIFEFKANVRALVERGEAEVLSQPSIMVLDGRQAKIDISDKVPYSREISSTLDVSNKIILDTQYQDVGIVLNLRPRASEDDGEVTLKVEAIVSSAGEQTTTASGALNAPPVVTRNVRTSVRVANNTPFVIGGLIRSSRDVARSGIPYLSRIPGVGALFRRTNRSVTQKEVIVVVTPHVIPPRDRSFGVALAKDSTLFDHFGLSLYRNVHRVRSDDVFDLDFIRESDFMKELDRWAVEEAQKLYKELADKAPAEEKAKWPPIPEGDRATLARQLRKVQAERPDAVSDALLRVVERRVPGEDKLVKRMLLGIIERRNFDRHVSTGSLLFFEKLSDDPTDATKPILDATRLEPRLRGLGQGSCETLVLSYLPQTTTQGLPFDPPTAVVNREKLPPAALERFVCWSAQDFVRSTPDGEDGSSAPSCVAGGASEGRGSAGEMTWRARWLGELVAGLREAAKVETDPGKRARLQTLVEAASELEAREKNRSELEKDTPQPANGDSRKSKKKDTQAQPGEMDSAELYAMLERLVRGSLAELDLEGVEELKKLENMKTAKRRAALRELVAELVEAPERLEKAREEYERALQERVSELQERGRDPQAARQRAAEDPGARERLAQVRKLELLFRAHDELRPWELQLLPQAARELEEWEKDRDARLNSMFEARLRELNVLGLDKGRVRWESLAVLLNDCYRTRDRSALDHLKSVMVLKRILDLNPTLPLTLEGFHAGREVVFPAEEDLESRRHVLDREAAALFYETLDYYFAAEQSVRRVLEVVQRSETGGTGTAPGPSAAPAPDPTPAPATAEPSGPARVRIVVHYGIGTHPRPVAARIASTVRVALPPPGPPR